MQKKSYTVNFGHAVTAFPKAAAKRIAKGEADLTEVRVLTACMMCNGSAVSLPKICAQTGLDEDEVSNALAYWRGVGVLSCDGTDSPPMEQTAAPVTEETAKEEPQKEQKKVLLSREMPKYTGIEISALVDKDGGKLRDMIDVCQQMLGYIFSSPEQNTMIALCDWLGLEADFVMTLVAYYSEKKPGCRVSYIQSAAIGLVNDGVSTIDALNDYIKNMEEYDTVSGKLRSLLGIGGREFTKTENGKISHWVKDLCYGYDMIKAAYDVTCDGTSDHSFDFKYANKVLDSWYSQGIRTPEQAEEAIAKFKSERHQGVQKGASSGKLGFDPDEFMKLALKRSKENMSKLK